MPRKDAEALQCALDSLALSLPSGFVWSVELRKSHERAVRILAQSLGQKRACA